MVYLLFLIPFGFVAENCENVPKNAKGAELSYTTEDLNKTLEDIRNGNKTTRGASTFYFLR